MRPAGVFVISKLPFVTPKEPLDDIYSEVQAERRRHERADRGVHDRRIERLLAAGD